MTADPPYAVLVFSRTAGYRHDSIPDGLRAVGELGRRHDFTVHATEDGGAFTPAGLARYRAVVFLNTSGDVLDDARRAAFESYVRGGGGFAGIHSAADTEYGWPFYGELVGARFRCHPEPQEAVVRVEDRSHPSTAHLEPVWRRYDEWYDYRTNPRPGVRVLMSLDEASYSGGGMGDHPIAWCHDHLGGRSWYTGGGHTRESYADPAFRAHLLGGIRYAAGVAAHPAP
ncbi:ThuA domain-containing protein [Streptosporangium sp. NPDC004379]|uniref:ThuA domain-containing protein n=1 Tax=Streptosporangium sp. NPDC004379 TaxID=3366189 RepID=UPI00369E1A8A